MKILGLRKSSYSNVENEEIGIETKGNKDGEDRDKPVETNLCSLPSTDLFSLHPGRLTELLGLRLLDTHSASLPLFVTNLTLAF